MTKAHEQADLVTVTVRRKVEGPPLVVFDAWTDPVTRRAILAEGRYKNGVKQVDVREGGIELAEDRWKNRLLGETRRRYVALRRPDLVIAQVTRTNPVPGGIDPQFFAWQETIRFLPQEGGGTEIVATGQCSALRPFFVHAVEDQWREEFDRFERARNVPNQRETFP